MEQIGTWHTEESGGFLMADCLVALVPPAFGAVWYFGLPALGDLALAAALCVFFSWLPRRGRPEPAWVVTGLIYGLLLWPGLPMGVKIIGALTAAAVRELPGGLGKNVLNPALAAFAAVMLLAGGAPEPVGMRFVSGNIRGLYGETASFFLLLGGCYLWLRGLLSFPFFPVFPLAVRALAHLGGIWQPPMATRLLLFSVFLASDPVTGPPARPAGVVWALGMGLVTGAFWQAGSLSWGLTVSFFLQSFLQVRLRRKQQSWAVWLS